MQVIPSREAHLYDAPPPCVSYGVFQNDALFSDAAHAIKLRRLLFTQDTIPLSENQKDVVQTLLSRRSVLNFTASGEEKDGIILDIVMRNRIWKECIVYCTNSRRAAESVYAKLCAQLGTERRNEILLDLGDGNPERVDASANHKDPIRVVIASPYSLKTKLVNCEEGGWISDTSLVFIDNMNVSDLSDWEEIILAMPSRMLLCFFTQALSRGDKDVLPLWIESIQNYVVSLSPTGAATLLDRIERPHNLPLLRTFAFNAAVHDSPVQVSLTLLKDVFQRELEDNSYVPCYAECFLQGMTMIPVEKPSELLFRSSEEAEYADVSSLIVADAKRTAANMRTKRKRTKPSKKKERTASSRAAARRRRESAYADSLLLPAIVMIRGQKEAECVASAVHSAIGGESLLMWDEDSKEQLEEIVTNFEASHSEQLSATDRNILTALNFGVGVINSGSTPAIRMFVEEIFRGGIIPVLVADTYLGSKELLALCCAKSVLIESSALSVCDDETKGYIKASTAASLAGRAGKDDVGNMIVLWYDESVDDETAGYEIASSVLHPLFADEGSERETMRHMQFSTSRNIPTYVAMDENNHIQSGKGDLCVLSSSYDGVLRSVRRFGLDGYARIFDYTLNSYKGWLERAALRATIEKIDVEKKASDERLGQEDWTSIADHERKEAKMNEVKRVLRAMQSRYESVLTQRLIDELREVGTGRIIGIKCSKEADALPWEQKLLKGHASLDSLANGSEQDVEKDKGNPNGETFGAGKLAKNEVVEKKNVSAAVYVTILDQEVSGNRVHGVVNRHMAVCIFGDGMWTMVPVSDIVAIAYGEYNVLENVDLLMMPHPATFDVDPTSKWAKCSPLDDNERAAVYRVSDELIARMAGENRPNLKMFQIPEFKAQTDRMDTVQRLYRKSPWYGRDDEILELRRLRRRSAELGDELRWLQKSENQLDETLFNKQSSLRSNQLSLMAVLEDCHAVAVMEDDNNMEMTPIGVLGSLLPSDYPVFSAACLFLIDDIETLSPSEFAGFTATVVCSGRVWPSQKHEQSETKDVESEEEKFDLSFLRNDDKEEELMTSENGDGFNIESSDGIVPQSIQKAVNEIQEALHHLHRRHLEEQNKSQSSSVSDIVPTLLNTRVADAVGMFADGSSWAEVVKLLGNEGKYAVEEMRRVKCVLGLICGSEICEEFSDKVKELALRAYEKIDRWPVQDKECIVELVENGVVEKHWSGATYDKWWRGARDLISEWNGAVSGEGENDGVKSVKPEVMESSF